MDSHRRNQGERVQLSRRRWYRRRPLCMDYRRRKRRYCCPLGIQFADQLSSVHGFPSSHVRASGPAHCPSR